MTWCGRQDPSPTRISTGNTSSRAYKALWQPLKDAGKRVLFTSDGTYDMFYDDIAAAGADGFCFEPTNDLRKLVEQYGQTHVIMGGADCRTLTFGTREEIERELRDIFALARDCPGFVFATGNHLPRQYPTRQRDPLL